MLYWTDNAQSSTLNLTYGEIYGFNPIIRLIGKKESDFFFKHELHKISSSQLMGLIPHVVG